MFRCQATIGGRLLLALLLWAAGPVWGQETKVEITVEGVPEQLQSNVLNTLRIYKSREDPLLTEGLIRRYHAQADKDIRQALEPFGYYRPNITSGLEPTEDGWRAVYRIEPGPQIRLDQVDVVISGEGSDDPAFRDWRAEFPLKRGDALLHEPYENAKSELERKATIRGYLDARWVEHVITVDLERYSGAIKLHFDTGARYRFGAVTLEQDAFNEDFLRRFITFKEGEYYDADRLLGLQRTLTGSDYFSIVNVDPKLDETTDLKIPVTIALAPKKPTRYIFGLGYGTDTGPRVRLGVERRYLNRRGHKAGLDLRLSEVRSEGNLYYRIPLRKPATDSLTFGAKRVDEETDTSSYITDSVSATIVQVPGKWTRTVSLSYEKEDYTVGADSGVSTLVLPRLGFERVDADSRVYTTRGWRLSTALSGSSDTLGSDVSFGQLYLNGKYIRAIGKRKARIIVRSEMASTQGVDIFALPASHRFFAGGDNSVRGYDYQSIGPTDEAGDVIGGKHLLVFSAEYDYPLGKRFSAAVFTDAGNAFNAVDDVVLKQGAGIGARWHLPFGSVRLDLASTVNEDENSWRIHLTLGPDL